MSNFSSENNARSFFTADRSPVSRPVLPDVPSIFSFEVSDSKVGRSIVAIALNHGNPDIDFSAVKACAEAGGFVEKAKNFQGIALSDVPSGGAQRYLFSEAGSACPSEIFMVEDVNFNGFWHVFPLNDGKRLLGDYKKGDGFLLISAMKSYVAAIYTGSSWLIEGGGGTAYSRFLRNALIEATKNTVVTNLVSVPKDDPFVVFA